jgi:hypothetical protein
MKPEFRTVETVSGKFWVERLTLVRRACFFGPSWGLDYQKYTSAMSKEEAQSFIDDNTAKEKNQ